MNEDLTPRQQILLWDLVSRGGSALQMDLKPPVKPADRDPLKQKRHISVAKDGRAMRLTLEESGWNQIAAKTPSLLKSGEGSKYDRPILQFVLARIQAYASEEGVAFASIFARRHEAKVAADDVKDDHSDSAPSREGRKPAAAEQSKIAPDICAAFFEIAGRPARDNVRLSALRAKLKHIDRAELDAALLAMRKAGAANLMNLDNPRDIEAEKDAALRSGMQTFHVVWIEE